MNFVGVATERRALALQAISHTRGVLPFWTVTTLNRLTARGVRGSTRSNREPDRLRSIWHGSK